METKQEHYNELVVQQQKLILSLQHRLELLEDVVIKDQPKFYPLSERVDQLENNAKNVQTILEEHGKDNYGMAKAVLETRKDLESQVGKYESAKVAFNKDSKNNSIAIGNLFSSSNDEKQRVDHLEQRIEAHAEMLNEHGKGQEKRSDFYADLQSTANWDEPFINGAIKSLFPNAEESGSEQIDTSPIEPDYKNPEEKEWDQFETDPYENSLVTPRGNQAGINQDDLKIVQDLSCQIAQMKRDTQGMVTELEQLREFKTECDAYKGVFVSIRDTARVRTSIQKEALTWIIDQ